MKGIVHCIGAAKAGTTWLFSQLSTSRDFYFTPEKEIHYYFTRYGDFNRLTTSDRFTKLKWFVEKSSVNYRHPQPEPEFYRKFYLFQKNLDWYLNFSRGPVTDSWYRSLFKDAETNQWVCDFSPSTSKISVIGMRALREFDENVKIIYMLRDPIDRLWSHIKFHATWIGKLEEVMAMTTSEKVNFVNKFDLLSDGMYGVTLQKLYEVFSPEDILLIDFEKVKSDPHSVLLDVGNFLNVEKPKGTMEISQAVNTSAPKPIENDVCMSFGHEICKDLDILQGYGFRPAAEWYKRLHDAL